MIDGLAGFILFMAIVGSLGAAAIIAYPFNLSAWVGGFMVMGYCWGAAVFAWIFGRKK